MVQASTTLEETGGTQTAIQFQLTVARAMEMDKVSDTQMVLETLEECPASGQILMDVSNEH